MWFVAGRDNVNDWLSAHTRIWDSFAEEDGHVTSAYGARWRKWWPVDQLGTVIEKLRLDPSNRHGVVITWDPEYDLVFKQKNVPCPYTFTVGIIGGRLHLHNIVRSNDMVLGFPTDVAGFAFLQMVLAQRLGVRPGVYTHSISNAHIYADHYDAAQEMVNRYFQPGPPPAVRFELPDDAFKMCETLDEGFFKDVLERVEASYRPLPPIKGLSIAL